MTNSNNNRLLAGIDIFIEAPFTAQLPKQIGSLKLEHISSRGTKLKGAELEKQILDVHWLCARYIFESALPLGSGADQQVLDVIQKLGTQFVWSSVIKLYNLDAKPQYS